MPRLIDADKLQKAIPSEEDNITGMGMTYDERKAYNDGIDEQWKKIVNAPTIEPERKKGKWIPHEGSKFVGFPYMHYECSECRVFEPTETNFCPNCGADMRQREDDNV